MSSTNTQPASRKVKRSDSIPSLADAKATKRQVLGSLENSAAGKPASKGIEVVAVHHLPTQAPSNLQLAVTAASAAANGDGRKTACSFTIFKDFGKWRRKKKKNGDLGKI